MDFQRVTVEPVRFIPFDLGVSLDKQLLEEIENRLRKKFIVKDLNQRQDTILSRKPIQIQIDLNLSLCLFETGIGVFIFHDETENYDEELLFAAKYLQKRRENHQSLLNWNHPISALMHTVMEEMKHICVTDRQQLRPTANENNGLSYVMTIAFVHPQNQKKETLQYDALPTYLQKGIPAILNPAFLGLNDSILLPQKKQQDQDYILELMNSIEEVPHDYEQRKHIMTFMSWASVIILGSINDHDKEEYISLQIELQHYWNYIHCMEKSLPEDADKLAKANMKLDQVINLKFEANLIEEDVQFINDSSLPERFRPLTKGLIETSQILNELHRYKNKLEYWHEIMLNKQQEKQKLLTPTSEILLFTVAYLQIAPDLYDFFIKPSIKSVAAFVSVIFLSFIHMF